MHACMHDDPLWKDRLFTDGVNTDLHLDIGNGVSLEKVNKLYYLGDILDVDGGYGSAVMARVKSAWKTFCEFTCVRSCLMYGSKNLAAAISKCFFGRSSGDVA